MNDDCSFIPSTFDLAIPSLMELQTLRLLMSAMYTNYLRTRIFRVSKRDRDLFSENNRHIDRKSSFPLYATESSPVFEKSVAIFHKSCQLCKIFPPFPAVFVKTVTFCYSGGVLRGDMTTLHNSLCQDWIKKFTKPMISITNL